MIHKRLMHSMEGSFRCVAVQVLLQWISLLCNIVLMAGIARVLSYAWAGYEGAEGFEKESVAVGLVALILRYASTMAASRVGYLSAKRVKEKIRKQIYVKLLHLGLAYQQSIRTSEVVQLAVEGVDQLEVYFSSYLPQFFYSILAPLTLFLVLSRFNWLCAILLFICVPLIPLTIIAVQRFAKKLLGKYWGEYTSLGDSFLENLQGLTTLKIYQADEDRHQKMNAQAERFRRITMKVLTMQLNSIIMMDWIAYGGTALGIILAVWQIQVGRISGFGALLLILLAADFFLPMRMLGSYFHIAMNGMAAADRLFALLDLPESQTGNLVFPSDCSVRSRHLYFAYDSDREVLKDVNLEIAQGQLVALVGESGCGKSTLAALLMGRIRGYRGALEIGGVPLFEIREEELVSHITYVGHQSYLFRGSIREILRMGCEHATDEDCWKVLEQVKLADFLRVQDGLDSDPGENGVQFSGGQRQRLAVARALLHDTPIYIWDEATSNIDCESEAMIMQTIQQLAGSHTVLVISHRLAHVVKADRILVLKQGILVEQGTHEELLAGQGEYARLWEAQQLLESYGKGNVA